MNRAKIVKILASGCKISRSTADFDFALFGHVILDINRVIEWLKKK